MSTVALSKALDWSERSDLSIRNEIERCLNSQAQTVLWKHDRAFAFSFGQPALNAWLNGVIGINDSAANIIALSNELRQTVGFDIMLWVREHADLELEQVLVERGFAAKRIPGMAGMVVERPIELAEVSADWQISRVKTSDDAKDFVFVAAAAFGLTPDMAMAFVGPVDALHEKNGEAFLIRKSGKPIAASMITLIDGVGAVFNVGTVPEVRAMGLGKLSTILATNAGFELGAKAVLLQASEMGEPMYVRLGYRTFTRYRHYPIAKTI